MPTFSKLFTISTLAVFCFFAFGAIANSLDEKIITKEFAASVNEKTKGRWIASEDQGLMSGATKKQLMRLCGTRFSNKKFPRKTYGKSVADLPTSFDASEKWPNCPTIKKISDQSGCGSCWAMSTTNALSDRFCTYGVNSNLYLSPGNVLECDFGDSGCNGGEPMNAYNYMQQNGVPTQQCQAYPFPECAHHVVEPPLKPCVDHNTPNCPGQVCTFNASSETYVPYYAANSWSVYGESDYMNELMTNGPFAVAFSVYADFPTYKGGVYTHTTGEYLGGHAVRLVGWGVWTHSDGSKQNYWKIANSWNQGWGMSGYFLIARGVNECGIEVSGAAAAPQKSGSGSSGSSSQ
jgi:C1A family cysteine protease